MASPSGLVAMARRAGVYTVLDTSGPALREALAGGPNLVKPNREELAAWSGTNPQEPDEIRAAAGRMREAGAEAVAVSLGAGGLLYLGPEGSFHLVPPPVAAVNPVGSGDSLVAGVVAGRLRGWPVVDALRLGVACGTDMGTPRPPREGRNLRALWPRMKPPSRHGFACEFVPTMCVPARQNHLRGLGRGSGE